MSCQHRWGRKVEKRRRIHQERPSAHRVVLNPREKGKETLTLRVHPPFFPIPVTSTIEPRQQPCARVQERDALRGVHGCDIGGEFCGLWVSARGDTCVRWDGRRRAAKVGVGYIDGE
jgi:hypothetical protein